MLVLVTNILTTLLSFYPLFTTFIIEGEVYANQGLYAGLFVQLTFWILVWLIISIYFVDKINIHVVIVTSLLNIILALILVINFLNINLLQPSNPKQIYTYLAAYIGISILYLCSKIIYSKGLKSNKISSYIPIILAIILGIAEIVIL